MYQAVFDALEKYDAGLDGISPDLFPSASQGEELTIKIQRDYGAIDDVGYGVTVDACVVKHLTIDMQFTIEGLYGFRCIDVFEFTRGCIRSNHRQIRQNN